MKEDITIKRIEEVRGVMSQEEFAKSIKSSQPVISKILSGDQQASINVLTEISKNYGVSIDWLLGLSSRKSLKGYSVYDETRPLTYADIIAFFVTLMQNNSIVYEKISQEEWDDYSFNSQKEYCSKDMVFILDHYIGDVISSVYSLVKTNPESTDSILDSMVKNYDFPLVKWSNYAESFYRAYINDRSSLKTLKEYVSQTEHLEKDDDN